MGTGRDDFSKDTIRKAAGRVGYRCSFPGCPNATIGASMENTQKTSITGVAAHICAAAEGGPRYDKSMTETERSGIENCIWLCQTHSKLIDTDVKTYPVEVLRQWKADAEIAASKSLANGDYFSEYYNSNGDNLAILQQLFDDMIIEGQFSQLHTMLAQYKTIVSEQYEEFVLRYKCIYDVYCSRSQLKNHLDDYCKLSCKIGVDALAELFLSFHLNESLQQVIDYCSSEPLKKFAKLAIANELTPLLVAPVGSTKTVEIPTELKDTILKYATNHIIQNKILGAIDVCGEKYLLFSVGFYYHAVSAAYELACSIVYGSDSYEDITAGSNYLFIRDNLDKISLLDATLQEYIWGQFLSFHTENYEQFKIYYEKCPSALRHSFSIQKSHYICMINHDPGLIDCDSLLEYVSKSGDNALMCLYLTCIEKGSAIEFLDEHGYLYKRDSIYLKLKLDLMDAIQPDEAYSFLSKYSTLYTDDFTFHLLLVKYANPVISPDEELEWLKARQTNMHNHDVIDYIRILRKHQCWTDLVELSKQHLPNEYLFAIAGYLSESEDDAHIKVSRDLYKQLIALGWKRRGLHFNLGIVQRHLGLLEEAKPCFQNEYDMYSDTSALTSLVRLRYTLNEYTTDGYFDQLRRTIDSDSQNLVAAIYMKRCNYTSARNYFLRSLLLKGTDNPSINGFFQTVSHIPKTDTSMVGENVFCTLQNDNSTLHIAIHENDVMEGIVTPNTFADYSHYSVHDAKIASLLFAAQGDTVLFDGAEYELTEIISANDAIQRFFFSTLSDREGVTMICSSSPEELRDQMVAILKESSDELNRQIEEYNQQDIRFPLSVFASVTGKGRLKTCEFLAFENREKIRNNLSVTVQSDDNTSFVLSYDSIVYLAHLGIDRAALNGMNLLCSPQVKNQLLNDINEELSDITDGSQKATMFYEEGKLSLLERTSNMRRARYSFLTRLKSFVDSLHVESNASSFSPSNQEMKDDIETLLSNQQLYCESTSLSAVRNLCNAVLVTDDQFLYALANTEDIPNIGLTGFFASSNLHWEKLLSVSKQLRNMNYMNYLPIQLYQRIVDNMLNQEIDSETGSAAIQTWIISDTDGEATSYHDDVVIALYREVVNQKLVYLNPNNFLRDIAITIWEKRNPGFLKKCIIDAFNSLLGTE